MIIVARPAKGEAFGGHEDDDGQRWEGNMEISSRRHGGAGTSQRKKIKTPLRTPSECEGFGSASLARRPA